MRASEQATPLPGGGGGLRVRLVEGRETPVPTSPLAGGSRGRRVPLQRIFKVTQARAPSPQLGRDRDPRSRPAEMPRDDFERLERRWRERPLFLDRPSRKPLWLLLALLAAVGLLLGVVAVDPPSAQRVVEGLTTSPPDSPSEKTAQTTPAPHGAPPIAHGQ
jgi:hypothetical protein